jgi:hypothetical protein
LPLALVTLDRATPVLTLVALTVVFGTLAPL